MPNRFRTGVSVWTIVGVFAVVLFIAAVLFPVFQKIRENSHHGVCLGNMKQLGLALFQYTQDNNNTLPPSLWPSMKPLL